MLFSIQMLLDFQLFFFFSCYRVLVYGVYVNVYLWTMVIATSNKDIIATLPVQPLHLTHLPVKLRLCSTTLTFPSAKGFHHLCKCNCVYVGWNVQPRDLQKSPCPTILL